MAVAPTPESPRASVDLETEVLIVGAGPVGLFTANFLGKKVRPLRHRAGAAA